MINTESQKWLYYKLWFFKKDKPDNFIEWIIDLTKEDLLYILWDNYETSIELEKQSVTYLINWKETSIPNENLWIIKNNLLHEFEKWDIYNRIMEILYSDPKVLKHYLKEDSWQVICTNYEIFTIN